jgi:hypothetical protein
MGSYDLCCMIYKSGITLLVGEERKSIFEEIATQEISMIKLSKLRYCQCGHSHLLHRGLSGGGRCEAPSGCACQRFKPR